MSVSSARAGSRAHPQGLRVATVSVLIGAAAIAGLLLGSSLTSDAPARPDVAGESGAGGLLLVLLLVAVGLSFVAGATVGLRVQRRARAGATRGGARAESARMPGPAPARSQGERRVSAAPENNGKPGSTPPPARG